MNKKELTNAIAERTGLSKFESRKVLNAVIEIITEEMVRNGRLLLIGFGTFSVKQKAARKGMNPSTFAPIDIPAKKDCLFQAKYLSEFPIE
ncbi:HU family DNA-binding protein [Bacteroides fragilis]|nr:HU family DNA-binding protein [Bacteroides fragilis]